MKKEVLKTVKPNSISAFCSISDKIVACRFRVLIYKLRLGAVLRKKKKKGEILADFEGITVMVDRYSMVIDSAIRGLSLSKSLT